MSYTIASVITRNVVVVKPDETLQRAAELMGKLDVGALPVHDGQGLVGIVTDRDITVRATAFNRSPADTRVAEVMTAQTLSCAENEEVDAVMKRMGDGQVRRLPVLDRRGDVVGIVSLGDLATRQPMHTDEVLRDISQPGEQPTLLA
jgi:CBS domain-containing protein